MLSLKEISSTILWREARHHLRELLLDNHFLQAYFPCLKTATPVEGSGMKPAFALAAPLALLLQCVEEDR
jgi:hypothetical protein